MNTYDFLSIATAICPDRDLIVYEDKRWSFAQVSENANKLANALKALGVSRGDRVAMLQVNCSEYVETYFAAVKLGAIFTPLNFRAKADELAYIIRNSEAKVLFVGERYVEMVDKLLPWPSTIKNCIVLGKGLPGKLEYRVLMESAASEEVNEPIDDEDVTILMYTAGTTGRPKGVPLTHSGFVSYVLENVEPANPDVAESNLLTVPLYHVAGIQALLAGVYGGRTVVMMKQFEVEEWLETVQKYKVSRAMLVPTMLKWVVDAPDFDAYDLSSLKVITYGAAPMPLEVIKKAIGKLPQVKFINAFGQTETASTITSLGPEDHVMDGSPEQIEKKLKRLSSSIGKPLGDVEIRIVDEDGNNLSDLSIGEIWVRGPRVMAGYWKNDEKTSDALTEDKWLKTGDMGWMDEEGYIYLAGRGDDMIIRGGENISPQEVENVICSHPGVEEVAVIGVPDPEWGQQPKAIVVLKQGHEVTEEEIIELCRSRLAGFKRPRSVSFANDLPRNQLGKVLKKELRGKYENMGDNL